MSLYQERNNLTAKLSLDGEAVQIDQSLYRWYETARDMKEDSVTPSKEDLSLHSTQDLLPEPLISMIPVGSEIQGQADGPNLSFEGDTELKSQLGKITEGEQYALPLTDSEFMDLINHRPQEEANPEFIGSNSMEQIVPESILAYSQSSHVAQLYGDPKVFGTISKQTKRGSYRCAHCSENFPTLLKFAAHLDESNLERPYKCPIGHCPWKILGFLQANGLRRHCSSQHRGELDMEMEKSLNLKVERYPGLNCPFSICQKTFKRKDAYKRHVAMVHNNADSRFNKRLKKIMNNVSK